MLLLCSAAPLGAVLTAAPLGADLTLGSFLSDSMVLQRAPQSARLWGTATPAATVIILLDGRPAANASASANGTWAADISPQPAGTGHALSVSDGTTKITVSDVAFGDVYLCTGQSNMAFSLNQALNASAEIADSQRYGAGLRLATVNVSQTDVPQVTAKSMAANYTWARSGPDGERRLVVGEKLSSSHRTASLPQLAAYLFFAA